MENVILTEDPRAIEKLTAKIEDAQKLQNLMKGANKIIKSKGEMTDKVPKLVALGLTKDQAINLFSPDFCGRIGFADYQLTNNSANIRRMAKRVESLKKRFFIPETEEQINGVTLKVNKADNRVQLFFPGKPEYEVRKKLKGRGFKWAPSVGAWQRMMTSELSITIARDLLKAM